MQINLTKKNLGRCFWWQPEGDESEEREQKTRNDQRKRVEYGNAFDVNGVRQVVVWFRTAGISLGVLTTRMTQQQPFITRDVVCDINLQEQIYMM